jgi:hypothetical protein
MTERILFLRHWILAYAGMTGTTEHWMPRNDGAWIPAYAGMTEQDFSYRRNDGSDYPEQLTQFSLLTSLESERT